MQTQYSSVLYQLYTMLYILFVLLLVQPEVIGSLVNLTELWFDNNKVKSVPPLVGHLKKLTHLDACKNKVDWVAGDVENCIALTDFHLSSNNLKVGTVYNAVHKLNFVIHSVL